MPKYTKAQLEEQYEKLPDVLKDAIFSVEIAEHMFELGKKHGLTMEKTGFAAEETGFVILGLLPPREFASSLASRIGIDMDKAAALASDINHQVFFPLREALKDTHQIEVGESALHEEKNLPRMPAAAMDMKNIAPAPAPTAKPAPVPPPVKSMPKPPTPVPPQVNLPVPAPTPAKTAPPLMPPKKPAPITLAPLLPVSLQNAAPPIPQKPIFEKGPESSKMSELKKPPESPKPAEPQKPPPIILRQKISEDLQKEIAPLIGGISRSAPPKFVTREQTEKLVAEKLAEQSVKIPSQESEIRNEAPPTPAQVPTPPNSSEVMGAPAPIKLAPLANNPTAPTPPTNPPLGTAKVPALDLRNAPKPPIGKIYDGFDPYKEPIE